MVLTTTYLIFSSCLLNTMKNNSLNSNKKTLLFVITKEKLSSQKSIFTDIDIVQYRKNNRYAGQGITASHTLSFVQCILIFFFIHKCRANKCTTMSVVHCFRCLSTGVKVTRSVIRTKGRDLQYLDIYKLLLRLTHGTDVPYLTLCL